METIIFLIAAAYAAMLHLSSIMTIMRIIAEWLLFDKAGEYGWAAIVPVYRYFVKSQIAFKSYTAAVVYSFALILFIGVSFLFLLIADIPSDSEVAPLKIVFLLSSFLLFLALMIFSGIFNYFFGKAYGKTSGWCTAMIFFGPIMEIIMGLSQNTVYIGEEDY